MSKNTSTSEYLTKLAGEMDAEIKRLEESVSATVAAMEQMNKAVERERTQIAQLVAGRAQLGVPARAKRGRPRKDAAAATTTTATAAQKPQKRARKATTTKKAPKQAPK